MTKRLLAILLLICIAAALGVIRWESLRATSEISYRTVPVEHGDIIQRISVNGALNPLKVVNVGSQVSGTISKIEADFNQKVTEGQILAEIEPSLLKSQLEQSQASLASSKAKLELSEKTYRRTRALLEKDYVARQDLDTAEQDLENSRAMVAQAMAQVKTNQLNLGHATINSPVTGVVISRDVDVGQTVAASYQTPEMFKIAPDLKKMQINAIVSEADIGHVKAGMQVTFTVDAFPERVFTGTISQIRLNSNSTQNVVTYNVLVDVSNDDEALLPGMTALVNIELVHKKDILKISNAALRFKLVGAAADSVPSPPVPDMKQMQSMLGKLPQALSKAPRPMASRTIYVLDNGRARPVKVSVGISDGRFTEISSPEISEGTKVIIEAINPE
jgi:HlyD family secretion protein